MQRSELLKWLRETDEEGLRDLWAQADQVRRKAVGSRVYLRGLIEFSNHCRRRCGYCGLSIDNRDLQRYRMSIEEILACAGQAVEFGYGTIVLQSGEDNAIDPEWLAELIERIKRTTELAVTLSVGERSPAELKRWKQAGADRYLLRFETSNPRLFERIHPALPGTVSNRLQLLRELRDIGYEIGSGVMTGIPGQTFTDLAIDLETFRELDLDMVGIGPFIPHQATPLYHQFEISRKDSEQTPNSELMTYKMIALTRLLCPLANIPSTSALATLNQAQGREFGLQRGANIVMPNLTPVKYRALYEIYPAKACINETAEQCHFCMKQRIIALDREIGSGRGDSPRFLRRSNDTDRTADKQL